MAQTTLVKQLGLTGIHGNAVVANKPIISANQRGRRRHGALLVGADWKIETDGDLNLILYRQGGKSWRAEGYFMTLTALLNYLVEAEVRRSDLSDLEVAVGRIEALKKEIIGIAAR
jgi:hypothetical protein